MIIKIYIEIKAWGPKIGKQRKLREKLTDLHLNRIAVKNSLTKLYLFHPCSTFHFTKGNQIKL